MAVAVLHIVVLVVAVYARTRITVEPEVVRIQMAILQEDTPQEAPPQLELPPPPEMAMPPIEVPVIDIPDSQAITPPPPPVVAAVAPPPIAAPVAEQSTAPVVLDENDVSYLRMPEPRYPRAAKLARLQGTVLVWVLIDAEGRPREVRVHKSSGYEQLDQEGCDAVSRAQFTPYRDRGVARSAQAIVPIEFSLNIRTARRR